MAPASANAATALPAGQYKVVSIALDLTGKKLIDEICHVGAYSHPEKTYSQYVMPFRDVSQSSIRNHGIKVVTTFGKYRVLKEESSMRTLKTKSEYSTLCDFMQWLKETKGDADGILLAFHDNNRETVTPFLLEALTRYKILDDFFNMVPGFLNVCKLAEQLSEQPDSELKGRNVSLRSLAKHLLPNDETKGKVNRGPSMKNAKSRAKNTYLVLQKLMNCEAEVMASGMIMQSSTNRDYEMKNLERQKMVSEKFHSLKPLFAAKLRKSIKERSRAVVLRRYLIDGEVGYAELQKAYEEGSGSKESVSAVIAKTPASKKEKDAEDLVEMIVTHFKNLANKKDEKKGKEMGQGDPVVAAQSNESGTSASSTESDDEEFEEAHDEVAEK